MNVLLALGIGLLMLMGAIVIGVIYALDRRVHRGYSDALDESSRRIESELEASWRRYR